MVTLQTSEGPFTYVIQANGPSPRMQITGNNLDIPTGRQTVTTADFTDYGTRGLNSSLERTFYVRNPGSLGAAAPLNLTGSPRVAILGGQGSGMFSVITQPATTVGVNGSSLFRIRYRPTSAGCHWAQIRIINNDPARTEYTFVVRGNTANQSCNPTFEMRAPEEGVFVEIDGTYELETGGELSAWPNPVTDLMYIEAPYMETNYRLEIMNIDGRILYHSDTEGGRLEVHTTSWQPGMYFIRAIGVEVAPLRFVKM